MRTRAFRVCSHGNPDVLLWEDVDLPDLGPQDVHLHQSAVGFNFIDTYHRDGRYPISLPSGIGMEGAGEVVSVGADVSLVRAGDRVVYTGVIGSYAEDVVVRQEKLVRIPPAIDTADGVALFTKGMTAEYLVNRLHQVQAGEKLLVHAAAGGVGSVLSQWASHLGAHVIGVVSTDAKAELALRDGCREVVVTTRQEMRSRVMELTNGRGVDVVYDSVGRDSFDDSLACLKPKGLFVSYGSASGVIPPIDFMDMWKRGAPFLVRASINNYVSTREELELSSGAAFDMSEKGIVHARIGRRYALKEAAQCHRDAASRLHTGSVVLIPGD